MPLHSTPHVKDRRDAVVRVRLTHAEREALHDRAASADRNVSEYVRLAVLGRATGPLPPLRGRPNPFNGNGPDAVVTLSDDAA